MNKLLVSLLMSSCAINNIFSAHQGIFPDVKVVLTYEDAARDSINQLTARIATTLTGPEIAAQQNKVRADAEVAKKYTGAGIGLGALTIAGVVLARPRSNTGLGLTSLGLLSSFGLGGYGVQRWSTAATRQQKLDEELDKYLSLKEHKPAWAKDWGPYDVPILGLSTAAAVEEKLRPYLSANQIKSDKEWDKIVNHYLKEQTAHCYNPVSFSHSQLLPDLSVNIVSGK